MAKIVTRTGPLTGSRPNLMPQAPVRSNAADTSRDAERIITRNANQLSNPYGVVQTPAPVNQNFQRVQNAGLPAKSMLGTAKDAFNVTEVGCDSGRETSADMFDAVGEPRAPKGSFVGDWLLKKGRK